MNKYIEEKKMAKKKKIIYHRLRTQDPLFVKWTSVRYKMLNENNSQYEYYRDLDCVGLNDFDEFRDFVYGEIGDYPGDGWKLSRKKHEIGYVPGNIQWAESNREVARGFRRCIFITYKRKTLNATDWSSLTGIPSDTIISRIHRGWPVRLALTVAPSYANKLNKML